MISFLSYPLRGGAKQKKHAAINKMGETCTVLEMAAGTWHAVLSLDTGGIIFEVKHGGYQP
ncbi:hypothetical protein ACTFZ3_23565, partial [Escherichia coli]